LAVRQGRHQVLRCATDTDVRLTLRAASGASADRDGGRHGVDLVRCQELVHDFRPSAWADALERTVALPQQALPRRDELLMAHLGSA